LRIMEQGVWKSFKMQRDAYYSVKNGIWTPIELWTAYS
jgi:hypothetical protein